jgi:hypothetical protein
VTEAVGVGDLDDDRLMEPVQRNKPQ